MYMNIFTRLSCKLQIEKRVKVGFEKNLREFKNLELKTSH